MGRRRSIMRRLGTSILILSFIFQSILPVYAAKLSTEENAINAIRILLPMGVDEGIIKKAGKNFIQLKNDREFKDVHELWTLLAAMMMTDDKTLRGLHDQIVNSGYALSDAIIGKIGFRWAKPEVRRMNDKERHILDSRFRMALRTPGQEHPFTSDSIWDSWKSNKSIPLNEELGISPYWVYLLGNSKAQSWWHELVQPKAALPLLADKAGTADDAAWDELARERSFSAADKAEPAADYAGGVIKRLKDYALTEENVAKASQVLKQISELQKSNTGMTAMAYFLRNVLLQNGDKDIAETAGILEKLLCQMNEFLISSTMSPAEVAKLKLRDTRCARISLQGFYKTGKTFFADLLSAVLRIASNAKGEELRELVRQILLEHTRDHLTHTESIFALTLNQPTVCIIDTKGNDSLIGMQSGIQTQAPSSTLKYPSDKSALSAIVEASRKEDALQSSVVYKLCLGAHGGYILVINQLDDAVNRKIEELKKSGSRVVVVHNLKDLSIEGFKQYEDQFLQKGYTKAGKARYEKKAVGSEIDETKHFLFGRVNKDMFNDKAYRDGIVDSLIDL